MLTKTKLTTSKSPRKGRLSVEWLESRFNLSGLTGLPAAVPSMQAAGLFGTSNSSTLNKPQSLAVSLTSSENGTIDTTAMFGDTSLSSSSSTAIPLSDYSTLKNVSLQTTANGPVLGGMADKNVTIEYKVNVAVAGNYQLVTQISSPNEWGSYDVGVNGSRAGQGDFLGSGSWSKFKSSSATVWLNAGANTLSLTPTWGSQFNIGGLTLTPTNPTAAPATTATTPVTTPATTPANTSNAASGNVIALGSSATITADKYTGIWNSLLENGYDQLDIGYVSPNGAYVEYTVNAQNTGTYNITVNTAAPSYANYDLFVNGNQAANYGVNSTGAFFMFVPQTQTVTLNAGVNVLRFASRWGTQYNIGTINITQANAPATTPAQAPAQTPAQTPAQAPAQAPAQTPAAIVVAPPAQTTGAPAAISTTSMTSFNQLNVVASSGNDTINVTQSGDTLTVNVNGNVSTYAKSAYGTLVVKGGDGNDNITIDSSVTIDTSIYGGAGNDTLKNASQGHGTIVSIGGGWDILSGNGSTTSMWADSSDQINAGSGEWNGHVHQVSGFWGGTSTELNGQDLADPSGTGAVVRMNNSSLWGTGPTMSDVTQGQVSDCYLLAPLQTMANVAPNRLRELAVDLGDGTYAVQFKRGGTTTYVRVDGDLPANGYYQNGLMYAHPGASGNQWMLIMEKAYAEFRTGAWSYSSLTWGNFNAVLYDFGQTVNSLYGDANTLFNNIQSAIGSGRGVTIGTISSINSGAPLIGDHTYTAVNAWRDGSGAGYVTLRNPWGFDGAGNDNNSADALVTMSMYQLQSNMLEGSILI